MMVANGTCSILAIISFKLYLLMKLSVMLSRYNCKQNSQTIKSNNFLLSVWAIISSSIQLYSVHAAYVPKILANVTYSGYLGMLHAKKIIFACYHSSLIHTRVSCLFSHKLYKKTSRKMNCVMVMECWWTEKKADEVCHSIHRGLTPCWSQTHDLTIAVLQCWSAAAGRARTAGGKVAAYSSCLMG